MSQITLTREQSRLVAEARERVAIKDDSGHTLGHIDPPTFSMEEVVAARAAAQADRRRYTTSEILSGLLMLAEKERQGGPLSIEEARVLLDQYRAGT